MGRGVLAAQVQLSSFPSGDESPQALAIPPSQCWQPPRGPGTWDGPVTPGRRVGGRLTRPEVAVLLMAEPGTQAGSGVSCPKGQPFPPTGEDLSERWPCGCLQTQRAPVRCQVAAGQRGSLGIAAGVPLLSERPFSTANSCSALSVAYMAFPPAVYIGRSLLCSF